MFKPLNSKHKKINKTFKLKVKEQNSSINYPNKSHTISKYSNLLSAIIPDVPLIIRNKTHCQITINLSITFSKFIVILNF